MCLSETWLHNRIQTSLIDIPGYKCFRKDRKTGKGGGVVIYIRNSIECTEIALDNDVQIECLCLNVCLSPRMHFWVMVLYNPPACDSGFYDNLEKLLQTISHKSEALIFGDFNIDWSQEKNT